MDFQEILVGIIVLLAVAYLVRYFYNIRQSHKCDDCSLAEMQKESKLASKKK
jgi:hypothetical protein